ncbi:rRNA maturation RNase YbeY [Asticcacaulis sp. SL142]|uniref:rRNA maturation RNase YbeY n=1 Tax=Asticcacaulis sp. SL142 TaxID=2995155 RepID=UPI00226C98ED|nr:rRNA maturation RNase YbeY [Asticcacaulis sp. SL142]WAC47204.1 rRNA maturation RNase YbeY [Asticcacaulis sp. SL142]
MESPVLVDIEVEHEDWLDVLPEAPHLIQTAIEATFAHLETSQQADIVVLLTDDAEMKDLNKQYRQKNAPTNVLSFPAPKIAGVTDIAHLGDMALGLETCVREAKEQNKTLANHVTHLSIHGALHLLGYDHMVEAEAQEMEDLERAVLKSLNIADPYLTDET